MAESAGTSLGRTLSGFAAAGPAEPAVTCDGRTVSRAELDRSTNRLARAYRERGVTAGSFVTIGLPNGIEFVEAVIATWKLGAVPQPVSHALPDAERSAILDLVRPALAVGIDAGFVPDFGLSDDALPDAVPPSWKAPTSGGSTGRPKVVVAGEPGYAELLTVYAELFRIPPGTTLLCTGPLHHNGPFINSALTLLGGGHVVVMPRFDAEAALRLVERERVSWMYTVPTMMHRISRLPARVRDAYDVSSLRTVLHTAAPCPPWLKQEWMDWLGEHTILEIYGGTEAQAMTAMDGAQWREHPGSVGRVELGEMRILDDDGRPVPPGVDGQVWMRRAADAPPTYHYLGAEPVRRDDGWEWLGDAGHLDADGFLYVGDRSADLILVGGANVYPAEVESALDSHPLVVSSCVFGVPDTDLGSVPHALVQTRGAVTEAEIAEHVDGRLARYKRPRSYSTVDRPLRDESGKVRRAAERERFLTGSSAEPGELDDRGEVRAAERAEARSPAGSEPGGDERVGDGGRGVPDQ